MTLYSSYTVTDGYEVRTETTLRPEYGFDRTFQGFSEDKKSTVTEKTRRKTVSSSDTIKRNVSRRIVCEAGSLSDTRHPDKEAFISVNRDEPKKLFGTNWETEMKNALGALAKELEDKKFFKSELKKMRAETRELAEKKDCTSNVEIERIDAHAPALKDADVYIERSYKIETCFNGENYFNYVTDSGEASFYEFPVSEKEKRKLHRSAVSLRCTAAFSRPFQFAAPVLLAIVIIVGLLFRKNIAYSFPDDAMMNLLQFPFLLVNIVLAVACFVVGLFYIEDLQYTADTLDEKTSSSSRVNSHRGSLRLKGFLFWLAVLVSLALAVFQLILFFRLLTAIL